MLVRSGLKSSGLFQQIKNQELALELIKANDIVRMQAYGTFNSYADRKKELLDKVSNHPAYSVEYEKMRTPPSLTGQNFHGNIKISENHRCCLYSS